jgi:hypothetical protein
MFAAIVGLWFGDRMLLCGKQRMAATFAVTATTTSTKPA